MFSNNKLAIYPLCFIVGVIFISFSSLVSTSQYLKSNSRRLEVIKDKRLKRTYGEGWNVWDKQSILTESDLRCSWTYYHTGGKSLPMCVHQGEDVISSSIRTYGFWNECNHVTKLWYDSKNYTDNKSVFLDIGANIGSCVMQFLLNTNANITAFEPHPRNLFCLTSTLAGLEKEYQDRVTLFPIALGSMPSKSIIFGTIGNLGHSIISLDKNEKRSTVHHYEPEQIHIERLDSILESNEINIPVMKIDVEGFECNVIKGMGAILTDSIHTIHTEVSISDLKQFGCTRDNYLKKIQAANFDTVLYKSHGLYSHTYLAQSREN